MRIIGVSIIRAVDHETAIVDADGQAMFARRDQAEFRDMRCDQAAIRGEGFFVEPDGGFPMRTFEKKLNAASGPRVRDFDVALIESRAEVVTRRLGEKRHFNFSRLREMAAQPFGFLFPPRVPEREHPWRGGTDFVAITLRL